MQTIQVTVPTGAWSKEEKAQISDALTLGLAQVASASGKGDIRPYINVQIIEASTGGYAVGGSVIG